MIEVDWEDENGATNDGWEELAVSVMIDNRWRSGIIDSAAFSMWLDYNQFREVVQDLQHDESEGARSADGGKLATHGRATVSFVLWKCKFNNVPVRMMNPLPSGILIGRQFLHRYAFEMNYRTLRGSMRVEQFVIQGELSHNDSEAEHVMELIESVEVDTVIKQMSFDEFGNKESCSSLKAVVWKHRDLFKGMGTIRGCEHNIVLREGVQTYCAPIRRRSPKEEDTERIMVKDLLAKGVLEPLISPWAANNVFVSKKDGSIRCTSDFRTLNSRTVPDAYPMEVSLKPYTGYPLRRFSPSLI